MGSLVTGLQVKEKIVKYRNGFLEKSCKDLQTIRSGKEIISEKMRVTQTILEILENNMLKWCGHIVHMDSIMDGLKVNIDMVTRRKTVIRTTQNKVGKGGWQGYRAVEFNIQWCSIPKTMATENQ